MVVDLGDGVDAAQAHGGREFVADDVDRLGDAGAAIGAEAVDIGAAEGFRPWDLKPNSTMTNATVAETVKGTDGQNILVKYKDGEKKVVVPPETPIVTFVASDKSEVKAGAKIIIFGAVKKDDGTLEANRVNIGRDGITPPM